MGYMEIEQRKNINLVFEGKAMLSDAEHFFIVDIS
jgi:hypothetical protein